MREADFVRRDEATWLAMAAAFVLLASPAVGQERVGANQVVILSDEISKTMTPVVHHTTTATGGTVGDSETQADSGSGEEATTAEVPTSAAAAAMSDGKAGEGGEKGKRARAERAAQARASEEKAARERTAKETSAPSAKGQGDRKGGGASRNARRPPGPPEAATLPSGRARGPS